MVTRPALYGGHRPGLDTRDPFAALIDMPRLLGLCTRRYSRGPRRGKPIYSPDLWFPISETGRNSRAQSQEAVAICRHCPVKAACLTWAVEHDEKGIWGGLTEQQRSRRRTTAGAT